MNLTDEQRMWTGKAGGGARRYHHKARVSTTNRDRLPTTVVFLSSIGWEPRLQEGEPSVRPRIYGLESVFAAILFSSVRNWSTDWPAAKSTGRASCDANFTTSPSMSSRPFTPSVE